MTTTTIKHYRRPGRPRKMGSIGFDRQTGAVKIFVGYCEHGDPVLIERDDVDDLVRWTHKQKRRPWYRLFRWIRRNHTL